MARGFPYSCHTVCAQSLVTLDLQQRSLPHSPVSPRTMGPLPSSAVAQGNELLIHQVDESINTTFICHVTNAIGIGRAEKTILLKGEERPLGGKKRGTKVGRSQQNSL